MANNRKGSQEPSDKGKAIETRTTRKVTLLLGPDDDALGVKKAFRKRMKQLYAGALTVAVVLGTAGWYMHNYEPGTNPTQKMESRQVTGGTSPYMEENTKGEKTILQQKDPAEDAKHAPQQEMPQNTYSEDTAVIGDRNFYMFDRNILLPVSKDSWVKHDIPGSPDGAYGVTSEFYPSGEGTDYWTQKLSIHKINSGESCFDFADKLVNGIIVSLSEQASIRGEEFPKDDVSFNYVKKDPLDTYLYWGRHGYPDETQAVRVFRTASGSMYIITMTLRQSIEDLGEETIIGILQNLGSAQQIS